MKWHWFILLAGLGLYGLATFPGLLPDALDNIVLMLAGVIIASVAIFGFDPIPVNRRFGMVMIGMGVVTLGAGIVLAWLNHTYLLMLLSIPGAGLGVIGLRIFFEKRE